MLFSTIGVAAMLLVFIALNFIVGTLRFRVDMTAEKAYTLSDGTRKIISRIDTPVKIRFYCSQGEEMPVPFKNYAQRVDDLLNEYRQASKGKITLEKFDPKPDTDAEEAANADGVEALNISPTESVRIGISLACLDQRVALPALSPERERFLEYDLSRALSQVLSPEKPVIGVMSALQVMGGQMNPMMMQMNPNQRPPQPWMFVNELRRDFTVKEVQMDTDQIEADIKVLLVLHPKAISEKAQFAIDQFVLRGGKLIACLDPVAVMDNPGNPMMGGMQQPTGSSLEKLLKAWGLDLENGKVLIDMQLRSPRYNPKVAPLLLAPAKPNMKSDEIMLAQLDNVLFPFAGAFTGTPAEGLKLETLIKSSTDSQLVDGFMARMSSEAVVKDFKPSGKEYNVAVRLRGKFKTAFPAGKPDAPKAEGEEKKDEKPAEKKDDALKASDKENTVILFADSDFLNDQFCVEVANFMGQQVAMPVSGNLTLLQNMVELLGGDDNLVNARSRATQARPFTRVRDIQAKAESKFLEEVKKLEEERNATQRKIQELQSKKEAGQRFILSPEQKKELENLRKSESQAGRKLKEVRKELRKEVDSLENRVKWMNIAGMPLLVAFFGVGLALVNRNRRAAK